VFVSCAARTNSVKILADDLETMTETLERALAPLLTFGSFFSLGVFEYPRRQSRAYLSYLYALAKWDSLTYFYYYPLCIRHLQTYDIYLDFVPLATVTSIVISFYRFKVKILKCTPGPYIIILSLCLLPFATSFNIAYLFFNNIFNWKH